MAQAVNAGIAAEQVAASAKQELAELTAAVKRETPQVHADRAELIKLRAAVEELKSKLATAELVNADLLAKGQAVEELMIKAGQSEKRALDAYHALNIDHEKLNNLHNQLRTEFNSTSIQLSTAQKTIKSREDTIDRVEAGTTSR